MRMLAPIGFGLVLLLSGCVPAAETSAPTPSPTITPIFASDDEALAAAEEAYAAYEKVSDQILADGGTDPKRIEKVTSAEFAETEIEGFESFKASGYRSVGNSKFTGFRLQEYDRYSVGGVRVVRAFLCSDVSEVDVVDASGKSVVSADRPNLTAFEVAFDFRTPDGPLVLSERNVWEGGGVCP